MPPRIPFFFASLFGCSNHVPPCPVFIRCPVLYMAKLGAETIMSVTETIISVSETIIWVTETISSASKW